MVAVSRSTVIDAPIAIVWGLLRDFNAHDQWHPAVAQSYIENFRTPDQVGSVRNFSLTGGERIRERLLTLSDQDYSFRYAIVEADVPLLNYVAEVRLRPVTDQDSTFWSWSSKFDTPPGREQELAELVAEGVYTAGFEAVRAEAVAKTDRSSTAATVTSGQPHEGESRSGQAMVLRRFGGPAALEAKPIAAPAPGPGQVRIAQRAIGVNYIDIYCRTGYFQLVAPPGIPGFEAAGEVIDVGAEVTHLAPGQRVAYACLPAGAYTTVRTMDAALVIPIPQWLTYETAAAVMLKGIAAQFLLHQVHRVAAGQTVLVYAPAGGVGNLLCQWARHLGATVIGATSSPDKSQAAFQAGAQHVVTPGPMSLADQVRDLTDGRGADVIFDAVGRDSFAQSVDALASCGHLVSYGQASGDIGSWDISSLASKSATVSRPSYVHYTDTPDKVAAAAEQLFAALDKKVLQVSIGQTFALQDAAAAHRALESRQTTGSVVLIGA